MRKAAQREGWATTRERGTVPLMRLMVWIALRVGRRSARLLLLPACAYFFVFAPASRAASVGWLRRALGRRPTAVDIWRHYWCFATCLLDRVLSLNGQVDLLDVTVHGEEAITTIREQGGGAFLFGAHVGSFEVVRAAGRDLTDVRITSVMYEDNARKTTAALNAINPTLSLDIIGLGKPGSMLAVKERLEHGNLVGILADRSIDSERRMEIAFFGAPARFPVGPFRMAAMLGRPVVLMLCLQRADQRYDINFETISARPAEEPVEDTMRRYVSRLEYHCRSAPYNWFNFYDFWA